MVKPSVKNEVVKYLQSKYEVGVKLATGVVGISRASWYYVSKLDDSEVIEKLSGYPKYIRTDYGPEFHSKDYKEWAEWNKINLVYSEPGKPMQNGFVERFNRTFREDVLDAYLFSSISQFNALSQVWQADYNDYHPHESLGRKSPREFKNRRQPLGVESKEPMVI